MVDSIDIAAPLDELNDVKRANRALKEEDEELVDEITDSKYKLDSCYQTSRDTSSLRQKPLSQPPSEILHMIFERTIPPHFLLDPSTSLSPKSMWCQVLQQKKSIIHVCRTWHKIGLSFLYEDICIRRIYQLSHLLRTLEDPSAGDLKNLVRMINFYCLVPESLGEEFERQLKVLFALCPRLEKFAYTSSCPLPSSASLSALGPTITHLQLGNGVELELLENVLKITAPQIISLSIGIPSFNNENLIAPENHIVFPCLEEISCGNTIWILEQRYIFNPTWELPRLRRLTFRLHGSGRGIVPADSLKSFCVTHGSGVQFLHIYPEYSWSMRDYTFDMQSLLDSCPALEHIVVHPRAVSPLTHKRVKWVDIWGSHAHSSCHEDWEALREAITKSMFPMLTGVRLLSPEVAFSSNLPIIVPPNHVSSPADTFACRFLGLDIRHEVGQILRSVPVWSSDEDDPGDPDFDSGNSDSDSSGSDNPELDSGSSVSVSVSLDSDSEDSDSASSAPSESFWDSELEGLSQSLY